MRKFSDVKDLQRVVGTELGRSGWIDISQDRIDTFADATGDHQWIHVDPERASRGPFGTPIAHGYLTLSLLSGMAWDVFHVEGLEMEVNYGLNKVRFPAVVPVGSRVRGVFELVELSPFREGFQTVVRVTVEREGSDRPVCVAETLGYLVPK